ncbi:hypothetical protein CANARDRAFT_192825 [[Candida] arabinofermentans NRRL YB-2248]|uniref:DUF202 domain-containing protein n=1 Tax=[Candida] arabinofermentans NRRL YB-2248 TaxID=983967 RepID=A0A1E4T8F6_9ASCO|nr:hypothetical protein CANARDRAFT_192825 [[Candida] arabinofermentans NRRL YB-2248]
MSSNDRSDSVGLLRDVNLEGSSYNSVNTEPVTYTGGPSDVNRRRTLLQQTRLQRSPSVEGASSPSLFGRSNSISSLQVSQLVHPQSTQPNISDAVKHPKSLYNLGSLLLENKGSVARDHLASERTFLAWLRTSLSLASIGVGLTQLLKLGEKDSDSTRGLRIMNKLLGLAFIIVAILSLLIGCVRYFIIQGMLLENKFPASRAAIFGLCGCIVLLTGKVHGSLARAGKVKSQTPKVDKTEKPKKPKGRAYKRILYTKRFSSVATGAPGAKRRMNPGPSSK